MGDSLSVHGFTSKHWRPTFEKKMTLEKFQNELSDILKSGFKKNHDVSFITDQIYKLVGKNPALAKESKVPLDYLEIKNKVVLSFKETAGVSRLEKDPVSKKESKDVSENGLGFLKEYERFSSTLYDKDGARNATIGYGHLVHKGKINGSKSELPYKNGITKAEAEVLLKKDAKKAVDIVNKTIKIPLTQNQFDALVSMAFNYGKLPNNLTRLVNEGCTDAQKISSAFGEVKYSDHHVVRGLVNRRADEAELYLTGDYKRNHF